MDIRHGALFLTLACVAPMKAGQGPEKQTPKPFLLYVRDPENRLVASIQTTQEATPPASPAPHQPRRLRDSRSPIRRQPVPSNSLS